MRPAEVEARLRADTAGEIKAILVVQVDTTSGVVNDIAAIGAAIGIGGGIAPKILPFMKSEKFLNAFLAKGRFTSMLQSIPIKLSLNPKTALLGSAHFAKNKYEK